MVNAKPWYLSKGVWGGLIASAAGIASFFGIHVPEGDVQSITEIVMSIVTSAAGLFAVYGRLVAEDKLTG
ncbi:MAG: hypothetical protein AAGG72_00020 [Pseudomonadota bacterium]